MRTEIAQQADISDHKARQAIQVARDAAEILSGAISGEVKGGVETWDQSL
jgi:hypothetical protein